MVTTQNASTATSVLTHSSNSLTYLIYLLVIHLSQRSQHGTTEYRGIISRYVLWHKIIGRAEYHL